MIRAECTWGEGPDVLVSLDEHDEEIDQGFGLMHVGSGEASFGLSAKAARGLAARLIVAAERAEELDRSYAEHIKNQQV